MGGKRKRGAREGTQSGLNAPKKAKSGDLSTPVSAPPKPSLQKIAFVQTPTGDERRREADLYELLGSEEEKERIRAADCILSCLLEAEAGVPEPVLLRHIERRLFRGLGSGRNASRIGFSLVITEILGQLFGEPALAKLKYPGLTFDKVLQSLTDKAEALGNIPGQEERDQFLGQLFGLECFIRSRILFQDSHRWHAVLDRLLQLGNKKIWLRSQCGWVIVQAIGQLTQQLAQVTLERIAEAGMAMTPEGAAIWLVTLRRFPDVKVKPWRNPLSKKSLGDLAAVLKESFQESCPQSGVERGGRKQANWTAQLHFVWKVILNDYAEASDHIEIQHFWSRVVDENLFSKGATDGQKFKGFMVFQTFLEGLSDQPDKIRCIFSKNLMACLMNQAAKEDRYLHRAAMKTMKALEQVTAATPTSLVPVLESLLGENGAYNFDQRTSTKTIDKLIQNATWRNCDGVFNVIKKPLTSLSDLEEDQMQFTLKVYIDYVSKLLNVSSTGSQSDGLSSGSAEIFALALRELSLLAYSKPDGIPPEALSERVRELCRSRLENSLARLTKGGDNFKRFCYAIASIDTDSISMESSIRTSLREASSRMHRLLKRKSTSGTESGLNQALAMLHAVSIFQLFNEDPDAIEVLTDLAEYTEKLRKSTVGETAGSNSELLVEILLSMVARPSSLMRQVSQQVFDAFTSQISAAGLSLLTDPLATGESTKGQKELFNTEDDEMQVEDESDLDDEAVENLEQASDVEMDSDVEFVGFNGEVADDDCTDDEEDDEADKDGPQDLDELVGQILKSHRLDKDADARSSSSDGDMSDSEMLALDSKLVDVFKQRIKAKPSTKKQKKDAKQSVINFKHRILDLLDIYVRNEALSPLTFSVLTPLLRLMRTTSTKALAARACETLLNYQRAMKKARSNKEEATKVLPAEDLTSFLAAVHDEAGMDHSHAYAKAASAASLILASAMFATNRQSIKQVAAVYANTQSDWVLGKARLQNSFFADWNNWCQNHASLAPQSQG